MIVLLPPDAHGADAEGAAEPRAPSVQAEENVQSPAGVLRFTTTAGLPVANKLPGGVHGKGRLEHKHGLFDSQIYYKKRYENVTNLIFKEN